MGTALMLPENKLSTIPVVAPFYTPIRQSVFFDFELGGADFQDNSSGLNSVLWKCRYTRDGNIRIYNQNIVHDILNLPDITEVAFSFDINMQPVIAYNLNSTTYIYFFDSLVSEFVTVNLGKLDHPRLTLDYRTSAHVDIADVILAYTKDDILCIRLQRERYKNEHQLGQAQGRLWHFGLMKNSRLGFVFRPE